MNNRRARCGIALIEMLVALAISATLLTAVAVATDAAFTAYRINQEHASTLQRARLALHRMLGEIRATDAHAPLNLTSAFAAGQTVTDSGIRMIDTAGAEVTYRHDPATHRLYADIAGGSHVLLEGVERFEIKLEPMRSPRSIKTGGGWDLLRRATVLITVGAGADTVRSSETTGSQTLTLSAAVVPRKNAW